MTMNSTELQQRRDKLAAQLTELESQHLGIVQDVQTVEGELKAALLDDADTTTLAARRTHRLGELDASAWKIQQLAEVIAEVDAELARVAPHEKQDADLQAYAARVDAFTTRIADVTDTPGACVDAIHAAVTAFYTRVQADKQEYDELLAQRDYLRQRGTELDRSDRVPSPPDWLTTADAAFRGGELIHLWRAPLNPRLHDYEAAVAATNVVTDRMRAPGQQAAAAQRQLRG